MGCKLNNWQIALIAVGVCVLGAVVSFTVWAATGGIQRSRPVSSEPEVGKEEADPGAANRRVLDPAATQRPTKYRETGISRRPSFRRTSTLLTSRPTTTATSPPAKTAAPDHSVSSFFDLPNSDWPKINAADAKGQLENRTSANATEDSSEWETDVWAISKMLKVAAGIFGVEDADQIHQADPGSSLEEKKRRTDRSSWVSLSYLSLGMFLVNQMDRLLQLLPEELNPTVTRSRSLERVSRVSDPDRPDPWRYNSLNVLFADTKQFAESSNRAANSTESKVEAVIDQIVDNNKFRRPGVNDYLRAVHNVIKASRRNQTEGGIDCLWKAFCVELNNRATLEGVAGLVARLNGVFLPIMIGEVPTLSTVGRMVRSVFFWEDFECQRLFPQCQSIQALNYLMELATDE